MNTTFSRNQSSLAVRIREIQRQWSPKERVRRAELGQRRLREFLQRILQPPIEPEIWAVGAIGDEDIRRLAS
jgi:hypothetical protein